MSVLTAVHVLGAALAAISVGWLALTRRPPVPVTYLRWAAVGTVAWSLCVASVTAEGIHDWHQILWFPAIAFTAGALLLWAGEFSRHGWGPHWALVATWLAAPMLILAVRLTWGVGARVPLFFANTVYCFGVLLVAAVWISRRAQDPSPTVRLISRGTLVAATGILVAEAFRANITDVVVSLIIACLTVVTLRGGAELRGRPSPDVLIDDLGALLFVFDHDQRLVDLNAPARLFYTLRNAVPPDVGTSGASLLGADLDSLDTVSVELSVGVRKVRFGGYVQRLPTHGSPSHGWVCLLRRSVGSPSEVDSRMARRAIMNRLPAYDPATKLLSARAFDQALASASSFSDARVVGAVATVVEASNVSSLATVARKLAAAWDHRLESIALGRCGPLRVALVVRDLEEADLRTWCEESLERVDAKVATRSGTLEGTHALVDEALGELNSSWRRHDDP